MCLSTSCIHLFSYVRFPPLASPQLLAFMLFQYPNFSCAPVPLSNFLHAFRFNISAPPVSQQPLAITWFHYLTSPLCLSSNFFNFLHALGFNIYTLQGVHIGFSHLLPIFALFFSISTLLTSVPHLGAFTRLQYLTSPHPCASHQFPAFSRLVSRLHLWPLNNFLHASQLGFQCPSFRLGLSNFLHCFNIYTSPRSLPITSCVHFV